MMNIFTSVVIYDSSRKDCLYKYIRPMIKSLMYSNQDNEINLYIICDPVSREFIKEFLKNDCNIKSKMHIKYVDNAIFEKYTDKINTLKKYTNVVYYKIIIPFLFKDIDRYLWLDSDTITTIDLNDLYNEDMTGYAFYGFSDIEVNPNTGLIFINTGLVLTDADTARKEYKSIDNITDLCQKFEFGDEINFMMITKKVKVINNIFYNYPCIFSRSLHTYSPANELYFVLCYAASLAKIFHLYPKSQLWDYDCQLIKMAFDNNPFLKEHKDDLLYYYLL